MAGLLEFRLERTGILSVNTKWGVPIGVTQVYGVFFFILYEDIDRCIRFGLTSKD